MKLWMVVYIFNEIAMSVGPLPYGRSECEQRRDLKWQETAAILDGGVKLPKIDGDDREITKSDVRIACVESESRPAPESTP